MSGSGQALQARVTDTSPSLSFAVTFDYRCPFARNAHEHVVTALSAGAPWNVEFLPFSLSQAHVEDGGLPVWDDPSQRPGLLAGEVGIVVRDRFPEAFPKVHLALFALRHDEGKDLRDERAVAEVLAAAGLDPAEVLAEVRDGWPLEAYRKAHEAAVAEHQVFGVPTFIVGDAAVFVRLMTRPKGDAALARATVEHVLDLVTGHPELNEFKHTTIPR